MAQTVQARREPYFRDCAAIIAAGALIAIAFMGSTLLTPLYVLYQDAFGFSEITLTLIYAVYVVGNLVGLLFLGRLSDELGRRPVGLVAIVVSGISGLLFLFASGPVWLVWARMLSGLGVGLASGTGTAWLAELFAVDERPLATLTASSANFIGVAIGPLLSGLLAQNAPWPLHLSFAVYLMMLAVVGFFVMRSRETVEQGGMGRLSLTPRVGVPPSLRRQFVAPAIAAFGTFSLIGFYCGLVPSIVLDSLKQTSHTVSGAIVFELFAVATLVMIATRNMASRNSMLSGLILLLPSLALIVLAQALGSMPLLLAATALGGASAGLGYRGSLLVVNEMAPGDRRAEVVSSYYVVCFFGNSVPVIGVGVMTVAESSLIASLSFACTIAIFAIVAITMGATNGFERR